MEKNLSENLKKIILAGVGAVAETVDKSKELIDELAKKGEITVEQGKVLNEELKRKCQEKVAKVKESIKVQVVTEPTVENILDKVATMTEEELQAIKDKIDEVTASKNGEKQE